VTSTPIRLLLGLAPPDEHALEPLLYGNEQLRIVAAGANANELLALACTHAADAVLVSADLPGLDAGSLARLRANGLRTVGVALEASATAALADLDTDATIEPPFALDDLLEQTQTTNRAPSSTATNPANADNGTGSGKDNVLAVVGSKGAPGASEFALSFAAVASKLGRVLLAEFDGDGGSLALRAGADPFRGSLVGLARAMQRGDPELDALFPRWLARGVEGWPHILVGSTEPQPVPAEFAKPGAVCAAVDFLADRFGLVVCDVGQRLSRASEPDSAVRMHRDVVVRADAVMLVIGARPDQLQAGFYQLELLLDELGVVPERLRIVINRQTGACDAATADAITRALDEQHLTVDAWLPWDERALRNSLRLGLPLALARPRGRYARTLQSLVAATLSTGASETSLREEIDLTPSAATATSGAGEVALPWR
jgi:MinD-like ATPase involved in chromosome partitioning or flagellar assembly